MQTKSVSLHFMVFIKSPHKGSRGKKKEGEEEEKDRDRGRKNTCKNFYCRVEKICRSDEKLSKNLILVSHNYGRVTRCVRTLHRVILLTFLISELMKSKS